MTIRSQLEENEKFDFHLCGSRYLGTNDPDADWDFVVDHESGVCEFLMEIGFELHKETRKYGEDGTPTICVLQAFDGGETLQVSVEQKSIYKMCIMQALEGSEALRNLDRGLRGNHSQRDELWRSLYLLAGYT
jgi:hypothetical protein